MPVTQQGSRAGLITTVVILSIVSVLAIILAFWFSAEKRKVDAQLDSVTRKYKDVIPESALSGSELSALRDYAKENSLGDLKPWDVLVQQRNALVKVVDGRDADETNTMPMASKEAAAALAEAAKAANLPSASDNLAGAVKLLADKIAAHDPHLILVPSIWPETYCYVLSGALASGRAVAVFDLGAQAARTRAAGAGHLVLPLALSTAPLALAQALLDGARGLARAAAGAPPP